ISCPDPSRLEHGSVEPMLGEYLVGNSTSYTCFEGYQLRGSPTRTCQPNGKWSGETPICDNGSEHCPNPGTPPGSRRTGDRFGIDDKVTYWCDRGLFMFGSAQRVCQENHEWTGTEPACYCECHPHRMPSLINIYHSKSAQKRCSFPMVIHTYYAFTLVYHSMP
ncbi:UNVERIFIED_CONTAM: hypothetical protein FKN15_001179, partial [Acipenser sinensis]